MSNSPWLELVLISILMCPYFFGLTTFSFDEFFFVLWLESSQSLIFWSKFMINSQRSNWSWISMQTLNSNSDGILIMITFIHNLGHQSAACQGGQRIWRKQQSWGPHAKSTHPLWPQEIVRKIRGPSSHPSSIDQRPRTFRLGKGFWRMHSSVSFLIFIIY